jgi:hypothetical protein
MNLNPQIFNEFVERIRHETKWSWIQYVRFSLASLEVVECGHNPGDAAAAEALCQMLGLCRQKPAKAGAINANSIYRKGPLMNCRWTDFLESDIKMCISSTWQYFTIYPVKHETVFYGSLIVHHEEPLSEHLAQLLSAYAHEAAALERVSDLEQRVQAQKWRLHQAIIELAHAHDAAAENIADHYTAKCKVIFWSHGTNCGNVKIG